MSQTAVPVPGSSGEDDSRAKPARADDFFSPSGRRAGCSEGQQFRLFQQFLRQQETRLARRDHRREDSDEDRGHEARVPDLHRSGMALLGGRPLKIGSLEPGYGWRQQRPSHEPVDPCF